MNINKTALTTTKKTLFSLLSVAAVFTGAIGLTGCHSEESTLKQVVTCAPQKNSGGDEYFELVLGKDKKTIEQATIRRYTTMNTLKYNKNGYTSFVTEDGVTHDLEKDSNDYYNTLFESTMNDYENLYYMYTSQNTKFSWLTYSLIENHTNKTVELLISFDFTDSSFEFNDVTNDFLRSSMPFNQLYNKDEQRLEYTPGQLDKLYKKAKVKNSCSESQKDISKTLHNKTVVNLEKVKKSSKK